MPNRYTRDEVIRFALNQAQLANLEVHDMPNGVVQQDAFAIQWLQDILDFWYHLVPFSQTVVKATVNCTANVDYITLPDDFILDVRNGLLVQTVPGNVNSYKRKKRTPLQKFINYQLTYQGASNVNNPECYCVVGNSNTVNVQKQKMMVTPTPTINTQCYLWYYQLPARIEANQVHCLPNDYVAVQYIEIRAKEWAGIYEPGTAQKFCDMIVSKMKAAGLLNEPEDDEIPMDEAVYHRRRGSGNRNSWMGPQ